MTVPGGELDLPEPFRIRDFDGPLSVWIDQVYEQYRCMVGDDGIRLWNKPVLGSGGKASDGRDSSFWHAITDDVGRGQRHLAPGRAARLGRAWYVLELLAAGDMRAVWWRERSHGAPRLLVSTVNFEHVVILQEARGAYRFVSSYPLQGPGRRAKFMARAAAAWESGLCTREETKHPKWRNWTRGALPPAKQLMVEGRRV